MKAKDMWKDFSKKNNLTGVHYEAWEFGGAPDKLAELVLKGEKTATASAYDLYKLENEPIPKVGDYSIILDSKGEAKCIIQTTKLYVVPFNEVTESHAYKEGEGDKSLSYWRKVHTEFFADCYKEDGLSFNENINVLCEEFKVVYK